MNTTDMMIHIDDSLAKNKQQEVEAEIVYETEDMVEEIKSEV